MTWEKLAEHIANMTVEQRQTDVTILDVEENEFFRVQEIDVVEGQDILDPNHPYLTIKAE